MLKEFHAKYIKQHSLIFKLTIVSIVVLSLYKIIGGLLGDGKSKIIPTYILPSSLILLSYSLLVDNTQKKYLIGILLIQGAIHMFFISMFIGTAFINQNENVFNIIGTMSFVLGISAIYYMSCAAYLYKYDDNRWEFSSKISAQQSDSSETIT